MYMKIVRNSLIHLSTAPVVPESGAARQKLRPPQKCYNKEKVRRCCGAFGFTGAEALVNGLGSSLLQINLPISAGSPRGPEQPGKRPIQKKLEQRKGEALLRDLWVTRAGAWG